jgi:hypothetical protein
MNPYERIAELERENALLRTRAAKGSMAQRFAAMQIDDEFTVSKKSDAIWAHVWFYRHSAGGVMTRKQSDGTYKVKRMR